MFELVSNHILYVTWSPGHAFGAEGAVEASPSIVCCRVPASAAGVHHHRGGFIAAAVVTGLTRRALARA